MICIRVYQDKATYNKELAHALQIKANMVTEAIKGRATSPRTCYRCAWAPSLSHI